MPLEGVAGHPVFWALRGYGPRPALLIHSGLAHGGAWDDVAGRLADRMTMAVFDLPGHGRSADWSGVPDLHDLSTAVATELAGRCAAGTLADPDDTERTGGPVPAGPLDLVGHSFGAVVALRLALEGRVALRSLVLIEPVLFAATRMAGSPAYEAHRRDLATYEAALATGDRVAATAAFLALWGTGRPWTSLPEAQRIQLADRIHLIEAGNPTLFGDRPGLLAPGRLEALALPVLILRGGSSQPVIAAIASELARRLPAARVVAVAGAGHMLPVTHPEAVAAAIVGHIEATGSGDGG